MNFLNKTINKNQLRLQSITTSIFHFIMYIHVHINSNKAKEFINSRVIVFIPRLEYFMQSDLKHGQSLG